MKNISLLKKLMRLAGLAILIGLFLYQPGLAQEGAGQFFEKTGHWVEGVFLDYFNSRGGLEIFGYPLSKPFMDQGVLVQYFQKARMEWHPQNPEPYKVQLGLLGDELKYRQPGVPEPYPHSRRKVYFPETGHTVAYAFLDYFKEHGEINAFGYPITEMHFEEGKVVQYFQRMKLEWSPEDPVSTIQVGSLGEVYVDMHKGRMPVDAFVPPGEDGEGPRPATDTISSIHAIVSLRYWVLGKDRDQTVSVLVTDNYGQPVTNANLALYFETIGAENLPDSDRTLTTNEQGFAQTTIPVNWEESGTQIIIHAHVTYNNLETSAKNVFLLWF